MRFLLLLSFSLFTLYSIAQKNYLFIGTYTHHGSKGIYVYRFDAATGKAEWVSNTDSAVNPSYLTIAADGKHLYAVNETHGNNPGMVSAYSFDHANGQLHYINQQPTGGDDPCYVSETNDQKWVFVANYSGGNLSALPVNSDGSLQPYAQLIQHTGSGQIKGRQEKAHVHSVVLSPKQDYLFSADLGMDQLSVYQLHPTATQPLQPSPLQPVVETRPGSGPRHFTFHPNNRYAYLIEELSGTVEAYRYQNGKLTFMQRISSHPVGYKGDIGSADIHVSPDGNYVYASNRGDANSITIFSVQPNGTLKWKGYQPTQGKAPRNFMIDPSGNYLLVANQNSDNIVIFKRNRTTGLLTATGDEIKVPNPVCLKMLK